MAAAEAAVAEAAMTMTSRKHRAPAFHSNGLQRPTVNLAGGLLLPSRRQVRLDRSPRRAASVLLLVLVALVALALGTGTYLKLMQNEHAAARRHGRDVQCRALAESGVAYLLALLAQPDADLVASGGPLNNPTNMQGAVVLDATAPEYRGRFAVVAPTQVDGVYSGYRFGLEDESAKLNLNALIPSSAGGGGRGGPASGEGGMTASGNATPGGGSPGDAVDGQSTGAAASGGGDPAERLLALPGMTIEIADAILDWLDEDDLARTNGAEAEYYQALDPPYSPADGPLASIDELLLVRGVTPELLYGLDQNRNLLVDANELPRGALVELDNSTGELNRGWAAYLTVDGVESFKQATGEARANVNGNDLQTLYSNLTASLNDEQAKFIILARQYGLQQPQGNQQGGGGGDSNNSGGGRNQGNQGQPGGGNQDGASETKAAAVELNFEQQPQANLASLLDVVGATVQVPGNGNGQQQQQAVSSPWPDTPAGYSDLLTLYDVATVAGGRVGGRVNINAASRPVLRTIPGIDATTVEQIILRRDGLYAPVTGAQRHPIWLLVDNVVNLQTMRALEPHITAGGNVFSGEIVGFFDAGGGMSRLHVVIDRTGGAPVVVRRENYSTLGKGLSPESLGALPQEPLAPGG